MAEERLQKILARAGVASRRAAEELIAGGRVAVDGTVVNQLGAKADPARQKITLDGQALPSPEAKEYWLVHKPAGVVSTVRDPQGRRRVVDLLPPEAGARLYPVGRLDYDSEGLVLMTNDGELAYRLMHPRYKVPKVYRVWVSGHPSGETIARLRSGVVIDGRSTAPARVHLKSGTALRSKLSFIIHEGRKREIRLMCATVGHPVQRLVRVGLGPLHMDDLPSGACRRLGFAEVAELKAAAGLITGCKPSLHGVKKSARQGGGSACEAAKRSQCPSGRNKGR